MCSAILNYVVSERNRIGPHSHPFLNFSVCVLNLQIDSRVRMHELVFGHDAFNRDGL